MYLHTNNPTLMMYLRLILIGRTVTRYLARKTMGGLNFCLFACRAIPYRDKPRMSTDKHILEK